MGSEEQGLKAGIEIHQQLNTREKLFCRCPPVLRPFDQRNGEFFRYLRATESELGEIDRAAEEEMKVLRRFCYYTYDTTCLVENDEEPPAPMNREALSTCLQIAKMCGMTPVPQIHTMRKLVIDGSNTSGFQRTALVAVNGTIPGGVAIETICLEEEAAQRVEGDVFSLDRLGIPLVEITTAPSMRTPGEVHEVARYLGMVLRSTGRVRRGLGTIRQDINISIPGGARVEIKGVQELDMIAEVVRREARRQENLLSIRDRLVARGAQVDSAIRDATPLFSGTRSSILKKAPCILSVLLRGFGGLVGEEIQPGRRLGSELSDYAKKCGVGGIFHTDELPAYGVTAEEVEALKREVGAGEGDCVVIVAAEAAGPSVHAGRSSEGPRWPSQGYPRRRDGWKRTAIHRTCVRCQELPGCTLRPTSCRSRSRKRTGTRSKSPNSSMNAPPGLQAISVSILHLPGRWPIPSTSRSSRRQCVRGSHHPSQPGLSSQRSKRSRAKGWIQAVSSMPMYPVVIRRPPQP